MRLGQAICLVCIPYMLSALTLDQKVSLKLIESLWQEELYNQAEIEIDKFLSKYSDETCDESLLKMKADLLIKKKDYTPALQLLTQILEISQFTEERKALCYYQLGQWNSFLNLFETSKNYLDSPFGKKIWNLGSAEAIRAEQNIEKKNKLIEQTSRLFTEALEKKFDPVHALSLALIREEKKDYPGAYALYEQLYDETLDESYHLSMARMANHFNPPKALELLEPLRWKSGTLGSNAALFAMQILDDQQDYHKLFELSQEELKIAPEGYRKAKIALFHLKSLFYLKCFDKIPTFFSSYTPHQTLKGKDLQQSLALMAKTYLIKKDPHGLQDLYLELKRAGLEEATIYAGRILAKTSLEDKNYLSAKNTLEELLKFDPTHHDEYNTLLGLCYLNTQAYEVAERYFIQVLSTSPHAPLKKKALETLLDLPRLSPEAQKVLLKHRQDLDIEHSIKALAWLVEALQNNQAHEEALNLLYHYGNPQTGIYHQKLGELFEPTDKKQSLFHFEETLKKTQDPALQAYLHQKLFINYFEFNKDLAAEHLFQSLYLKPFAIDEKLFDGLLSHLYLKAFDGVKILIHDEEAKTAASQLLRLFSYKTDPSEKQQIIHAKTLRKLCRFEEALQALDQTHSFHANLEKAKLLNQMGQYTQCDHLLGSVLEEKPYTLFLEGQIAFLTKILLEADRMKAIPELSITQEALQRELKVLSVCISDASSSLAFEVEFLKQWLTSEAPQQLIPLQNHPFLLKPESGNHRKVLNFLVNHSLNLPALESMSGLISDVLEWILIQNFGRVS